jgi:hypothetical protein
LKQTCNSCTKGKLHSTTPDAASNQDGDFMLSWGVSSTAATVMLERAQAELAAAGDTVTVYML